MHHPRALGSSLVLLSLLIAAPARGQDELFRLSDLARAIGGDPAALDAALAALGLDPAAAGLLSPAQERTLRTAIARGDYALLDRFPALTADGLGRAVAAAGAAARARQGATPAAAEPTKQAGLTGGPVGARGPVRREALGIPTGAPALAPGSLSRDLGNGLRYGDEVDPARADAYADGARLAEVLDLLSENDPADPKASAFEVTVGAGTARSPAELVELLEASGHTVEVRDTRNFANFGDLSFQGREVATPFWVDTELAVPGTERTLLVPVSHSQHELIVRGPRVNTSVAFFFGSDGQAKFRPMGGRSQAWTGGTTKHTYTGERAREAVRLAGEVRRAYLAKRAAHPDLPFGGYYALGVCNDVNAMLELHLQGRTTLYPLTRDLRLFQGPGEVDALARRLPVDGRGNPPSDLGRILGALPVDELDQLAFPELRADVERVLAARSDEGGAEQDVERRGIVDELKKRPR